MVINLFCQNSNPQIFCEHFAAKKLQKIRYYCEFSVKLFHCVMIKLPEAGKWKKIAS